MKLIVGMAALLLVTGSAFAGTHIYMSLGEANSISIYNMDAKTGKLEYSESVKTNGSPGPLAVDPGRNFLFTAVRSTKKIVSQKINPEDGTLKKIEERDVGMNPVYLATDRTGKYLLSASYSEGRIMVHGIDKDGSLYGKPEAVGNPPLVEITTAKNAHCILPDPSNRFVFVPHTGPNAIFQFLFDAKNGALTPNAVPKVMGEPDAEPRHIWFHPKKNFAYVANEKGCSVTAYQLATDKGQLKAFQTLSTLPKGFTGKNTCAHIEMTPSGDFLYVSNRGHDSLAGFSVDGATGKLTALGNSATEKTPRAFTIEPSGRFLYAAGQDSGKLAAYRIDAKTGALERFATYTAGKGPAWVLAAEMP